MKELVRILNNATKAYDEGHPIMSDKEWDDLYFKLKEMEDETGIVLSNSPTRNIVYETVSKLKKVTHNHPMLSLDKTKELKEVLSFINDKEVLAMCKMDGLTCSLTYKDGYLVAAETRGNGHEGEDILHNAKIIPSIPFSIPYKGELVVDGEIICKWDDFKTFEEEYKNPRNFAAGSIRLLSAKECGLRKLTFIAWDVIKGFDDIEYVSDKLNKLDEMSFITCPSFIISGKRITEKTLQETIDELKDSATDLQYPIDGVVFKMNDIAYGKSLGVTTHHFKNALAYKFYDEMFETELLDIEWSMGRTGILTPIAIFNPVEIDGSIVERASLHNLSIMEETIGIPYRNQKVWVSKRNMIIPQIEKADKKNGSNETIIQLPDCCPICGGQIKFREENNTKNLVCENPNCEGKFINQLDHFCGKKGLDIKGLSKATLQKLIDWGWIKTPSDIFTLYFEEEEWAKKPGFGPKSVRNILTAIEEAKNAELWQFISALGIPLIGSTYAKEMCKREYSWFNIREDIAKGFDFTKWNGFGPETNAAIHNFDYCEADYLVDEVLHLKNSFYIDSRSKVSVALSLSDKKIVITGKLNKFKNRDELKVFIERSGGKVVGSISKSTDMLINNDINSESSKNITAKKLGIPIITEEEFISQYLEELN